MNTSFKEQCNIISKIKIQNNESIRINCPFCNGYKSFGLTKSKGLLEWNCFRNSCRVKGKIEVNKSLNDITSFILNKDNVTLNTNKPIPETLLSIDNRNDIKNWLNSFNSLEAYNKGYTNIKYSPSENRVMFPLLEDGKIIGYTGRGIVPMKPKWLKYGKTDTIFSCGKGKTGVLVEDTLSACAASALSGHVGLALLGTILTAKQRQILRQYDKIYICLDPDAASKSVKYSNSIPNGIIRFIPNDLKYLSVESIKSILYV